MHGYAVKEPTIPPAPPLCPVSPVSCCELPGICQNPSWIPCGFAVPPTNNVRTRHALRTGAPVLCMHTPQDCRSLGTELSMATPFSSAQKPLSPCCIWYAHTSCGQQQPARCLMALPAGNFAAPMGRPAVQFCVRPGVRSLQQYLADCVKHRLDSVLHAGIKSGNAQLLHGWHKCLGHTWKDSWESLACTSCDHGVKASAVTITSVTMHVHHTTAKDLYVPSICIMQNTREISQ